MSSFVHAEQCDICTIKPSELDTSQIVDQSWHHATYFIGIPIQVQVTFPGTAGYVYNVVPNSLPNGAITLVNVYSELLYNPTGTRLDMRRRDRRKWDAHYAPRAYCHAAGIGLFVVFLSGMPVTTLASYILHCDGRNFTFPGDIVCLDRCFVASSQLPLNRKHGVSS
ncbi:hypothetical protein LXA43DRAFT_1094610 [Ganoderma leucocontextum]|nr:hypothetical protein LXA43DRAFT_1094610 [Ganoderma leucocontextum]